MSTYSRCSITPCFPDFSEDTLSLACGPFPQLSSAPCLREPGLYFQDRDAALPPALASCLSGCQTLLLAPTSLIYSLAFCICQGFTPDVHEAPENLNPAQATKLQTSDLLGMGLGIFKNIPYIFWLQTTAEEVSAWGRD